MRPGVQVSPGLARDAEPAGSLFAESVAQLIAHAARPAPADPKED
jgi:hypothetical protein